MKKFKTLDGLIGYLKKELFVLTFKVNFLLVLINILLYFLPIIIGVVLISIACFSEHKTSLNVIIFLIGLFSIFMMVMYLLVYHVEYCYHKSPLEKYVYGEVKGFFNKPNILQRVFHSTFIVIMLVKKFKILDKKQEEIFYLTDSIDYVVENVDLECLIKAEEFLNKGFDIASSYGIGGGVRTLFKRLESNNITLDFNLISELIAKKEKDA